MTKYISFFTAQEEQDIVQAIQNAELNTSAEIRVHLENNIPKDITVIERTIHIFHDLKMDKTTHQNSVLFYISIKDKQFSVFGDRQLDKKVSSDFWLDVKNTILTHFKQEKFAQGLIKSIQQVGAELKKHFPANNNINELSNEISKS